MKRLVACLGGTGTRQIPAGAVAWHLRGSARAGDFAVITCGREDLGALWFSPRCVTPQEATMI